MTVATWTIDDVLAERPCVPPYTREYLTTLSEGRVSVTLADVLRDTRIPPVDRVWLATRKRALPADLQQRWLERVMTRAVTTHVCHCGIAGVEAWAEQWLAGTDRSWGAALAAAARAAEAAAATSAVAAAVAAAAAWEAAWAAEYERQVADLLAILDAEAPAGQPETTS